MSIHPDDWSHARAIFEHALTLSASTRPGYLAEACGSREGLRQQIERMLASHDQAQDFLETPAVRPLTDVTHATNLDGARIGPYELGARIGGGGMGEVYKAHDPRLGRTVAIKVLPAHAADDPQARDRFEREARAIAALTHPHICALYDVGEATPSGAAAATSTIQYLVMEHLEGETLAARLARGPLAIAQALHYAVQMASALDQAHRAGIVHRDLKPANVMLVKGDTKLLDFGLAKQRTRSAGPAHRAGEADASHQTTPGMILGTVPYMAPEQVEGRDADARTDVFAFGAVLYEMLTGAKAFTGATQANLVAAILEHEPASLSTVPSVPPALDRVVKKCLAKDPDKRWQSAGDLASELEWIAQGGAAAGPGAPDARFPARWGGDGVVRSSESARRRRKERIAWGAALVAVAVVAAVALRPPTSLREPAPKRFSVSLPNLALSPDSRTFALLPDGSGLTYLAGPAGDRRLHLYTFADGVFRPLRGTERALSPFVSPDAKWIGFFQGGRIMKVATSGGVPVAICDAPYASVASWGLDDRIVFTGTSGLSRIAAAGGTPEALTTLAAGEVLHTAPEILPGEKAVLFTVLSTSGAMDDATIDVVSMASGERRSLVKGGAVGRYSSTGHLVYVRGSDLLAVPFDPDRLSVTGMSFLTQPGVGVATRFVAGDFDFSADGTLAYLPTSVFEGQRTLVWIDRKGTLTPVPTPPRAYAHPSLLPDERSVIVELSDTPHNLWYADLASGVVTRLTHEGANHRAVLSPDGHVMAFSSDRTVPRSLFRQPTDGSGAAEQLFEATRPQNPTSWSRDGRWLAFSLSDPKSREDIWIASMDGNGQPRPFAQTAFNEDSAVFSPDGQWIAYSSDETGRREVLLSAFPGPGPRKQVSTSGGEMPVFSDDSQKVYYRRGDRVLVTEIVTQPTLSLGASHVAFEIPLTPNFSGMNNFAINRKGDAVLAVKDPEKELGAGSLQVIVNWFDQLRRASAR